MKTLKTLAVILIAAAILSAFPLFAKSGDSDPAKIYLKYRKAVEKAKKLSNVEPYLPERVNAFLSEMSREARDDWYERVILERKKVHKVKVLKSSKSDEGYKLDVEGIRVSDRKVGKGKVRLSAAKDGSLRVDRETWDFDWDTTFTPTENRNLAKNDRAEGEFTVNGIRADLSYVYAEVVPDSFEPEKSSLRIKLSDQPIAPDDFNLMNKAKEGTLHYVDLTINRKKMVTGAMLYHNGLEQDFISIAGNLRFKPSLFGPTQIAGNVAMTEQGKSSFSNDTYYFSADFKVTLWEISDRPLGSKPDGSFGIEKGEAIGTFTVDEKPFSFNYSYMRESLNEEGAKEFTCILTEEKLENDLLTSKYSLFDILQSSKTRGLHFKFLNDHKPYNWFWFHDDLKIGCYICSDLRFKPEKVESKSVSGTIYSRKPQTWKEQSYEFKASFHAVEQTKPVAKSPTPPPGEINFFKNAEPLREIFTQGIGKAFNLIQLAIYPEHAVLEAQDAKKKDNFDRYTFSQGKVNKPSPIQTFAVQCKKGFDMKSVDFSLVPKLAADAVSRLKIENGAVSHIILGRGVFCKSPGWSIYVMSKRKTGYVRYKLDGKHKKTYKM